MASGHIRVLGDKHQKIHDYREQIAMQQGTHAEMLAVKTNFKALTQHVERTNQLYVVLDLLNSYLLK